MEILWEKDEFYSFIRLTGFDDYIMIDLCKKGVVFGVEKLETGRKKT